MMNAEEEFEALKSMHPTASLHSEGGKPVVLLPNVEFRSAGTLVQMNLLLLPFSHSGYITRLFFEQKILGTTQNWQDSNWTEHTVLSRKWWAPSWNHVIEDQSWTSMLWAHLRAVA